MWVFWTLEVHIYIYKFILNEIFIKFDSIPCLMSTCIEQMIWCDSNFFTELYIYISTYVCWYIDSTCWEICESVLKRTLDEKASKMRDEAREKNKIAMTNHLDRKKIGVMTRDKLYLHYLFLRHQFLSKWSHWLGMSI